MLAAGLSLIFTWSAWLSPVMVSRLPLWTTVVLRHQRLSSTSTWGFFGGVRRVVVVGVPRIRESMRRMGKFLYFSRPYLSRGCGLSKGTSLRLSPGSTPGLDTAQQRRPVRGRTVGAFGPAALGQGRGQRRQGD